LAIAPVFALRSPTQGPQEHLAKSKSLEKANGRTIVVVSSRRKRILT
jgi:hypothetical protein